MKKLTLLILICVMCLFACDDEKDTEIITAPISLLINVFYCDTLDNQYKPDVNAIVYYYFDAYPFGYTYMGNGKFVKDDIILLPDTVVKTNIYGKTFLYPEKGKEISYFIKSGYFKERFTLSTIPEFRQDSKITIYFQK